MNTNKQINIMILLVFVAVFLTGAYTLFDPGRADDARDKQHEATVERGAWLFSQNCRACHGDAGEGGAASNRLRQAPPLNRPDLQGIDSETNEVDDAALGEAYDLVFNTITCGRVGTAMPTWGQRHGGTLNDEQIKQLSIFITEGGDEAWRLAEEYALEGVEEFGLHSLDTQDHLTLAGPVGEDDTEIPVTPLFDAEGNPTVSQGGRLQVVTRTEDGELERGEIMIVTEEPQEGDTTVTVERGFGTTSTEAYEAGTELIEPPSPPDPPTIVEQACGQLARGGDGAVDETPRTELTITARNIAWNTSRLFAVANVPLTITVNNEDDGVPHNWEFFAGEEPEGEPVAGTEVENGPVVQTLNFGPLAPGDYFYWCQVHPQMEGIMSVVVPEAGAGGGGGATSPTATP